MKTKKMRTIKEKMMKGRLVSRRITILSEIFDIGNTERKAHNKACLSRQIPSIRSKFTLPRDVDIIYKIKMVKGTNCW